MIESHETTSLVPPQLPPFLANVFNLKPILGNPNRAEVKLVHEAVRALNNFLHTPELRDTDLPIELSQHLFDIQMVCHRQKYPTSVLPNDIVYDPPTLPAYIPVELKPVTGPPSNTEVASVHAALRVSESFANLPSIFDPDLHVQLSQHLFDIQLARHVQRSITKRMAPSTSVPQNQAVLHSDSGDTDVNDSLRAHTSVNATHDQFTEYTETQSAPPLEQQNFLNETIDHQHPSESNEPRGATELMIEIKDTLKNVARILVGSQNSLARGFNSSSFHTRNSDGLSYDIGAHSLINDYGEVPETYSLPTFKHTGVPYGHPYGGVVFSVDNLTENILARYLRFYSIGEEMIEEGLGEEMKIKSGMVDDARSLLSGRLFLNRQ